jgi:Zn-dependent protease with chaperone function
MLKIRGWSRGLLLSSFGAVLLGVGLLSSQSALARVPYVDTLLGRAVEGFLALAGSSGLEATAPFRKVEALPSEQARLNRALLRVKEGSGQQLRYQKTQRWILVQGQAEAPNAFAVGEAIYITRPLLRALNDAQLTAVMAHEVAHAERGHLLERMGNVYAGVLVHLWSTLVADWRYLSRGEIDDTMRELIRDGHWARLMSALGEAEQGQEIQADCIAWKWLSRLKQSGRSTGPEEILTSIEKLLGVSADALLSEPALGGRIAYLQSYSHERGSCE